MSVRDFREIFRRETERHLGRLERRLREGGPQAAASGSPASLRLSEGGRSARSGGSAAGGGGLEAAQRQQLDDLRHLANDMTEAVFQRLADHAAYWGLEAEGMAGPAQDAASEEAQAAVQMLQRSATAEEGSAQKHLETSCRTLEAELDAKRDEEERLRADIFERFKAKCGHVLEAREKELLDVRQAVSAEPQPGGDVGSGGAAESQQEFVEYVAKIQDQLEKTKATVAGLERRARGLERIEAQQAKPLASVEALLLAAGGGGAGGQAVCTAEDQACIEAIQRGEQVCKRMRRHLAAGA